MQGVGTNLKKLKDFMLGKALTDDQMSHEKLSRIWGLPIMASDAVSSVAYAIDAMLLMIAAKFIGIVSLPVILLLIILIISYSQTIKQYPKGGGAYDVSKDVFGRQASLAAAACLIIGYILTVAVSIASSTAAVTAAFPALLPHKVTISVVCILLITLVNLRGMSESSKIFGVPTYLFIGAMAVLIAVGFFRYFTGNLQPIDYSAQPGVFPQEALLTLTPVLFLRAFASGCSGLTGVEAISNTVPSFKEPSVKTANHVLYMLGGVIILIFGGTGILTGLLNVVPVENATVISQITEAVFGKGVMFYFLQSATALILMLAANTAYNGMPVLLNILAHDSYVPKQFSHRGAKLSFSNGIIVISVISAVLLIAFKADTQALIPFYAFGVLVSFTISQTGMFIKWFKIKTKGWQYKSFINGFGALVTLVASVVVFAMKFKDGAWVIGIVIPAIMYFMHYTHKNYNRFDEAVSIESYDYKFKESASSGAEPCIVLIHRMNKGTLKTLNYAMTLSSNITALHISTTPGHTELLQKQWGKLEISIPLTVIKAPHREVLEPLHEYISARESEIEKGGSLTVVLTKFVGSWRHRMFHNQTTIFIENLLNKHRNVSMAVVPFIYELR